VHPKNPFNHDYNFETLIAEYPPLKPFVFENEHGNYTIKFADHEAVKALNAALLKAHYGITHWYIPENNLCPPIPGRLDYLLHVADLLPEKEIYLLDIGTGANLIYPILATRHFNWKCTASEVNLDSLHNAQEIITKNESLKNIDLRHQQFKTHILEQIIRPPDFLMWQCAIRPFLKTGPMPNRATVGNLKIWN